MKKCFVIAIAILIFVLSSGCDMHSGKRPCDYPPAKWVSEEPEMWFEGVYKIYGFDGCLVLDGQIIEIKVFYGLFPVRDAEITITRLEKTGETQ
jgi:hypothetical protein